MATGARNYNSQRAPHRLSLKLPSLLSPPPPSPALPTNARTCPACDTARGWLGIGPRSVWSASEELPTPARPPVPSPQAAGQAPRAPPPPGARTACGIEESLARPAARARVPRARGPTRGASRQASPRKASERGGAGGGVSKGLERVLSKTGPRTKRNPRCELADRRRLLLLPWQAAVSPQDSASRPPVCVCVCVCGAARDRGGPRSRLTAGPWPRATPRARRMGRARRPPEQARDLVVASPRASARRDTRPSRVAPRGSPGCG